MNILPRNRHGHCTPPGVRQPKRTWAVPDLVARLPFQLRSLPIQYRWEVTRRHPYYQSLWLLARAYYRNEPVESEVEPVFHQIAVAILGTIGVSGEPPDPATEFAELADLIIALACTGLRISELASLRWSDLDLESGRLKLTDETGRPNQSGSGRRELKSGRSRSFPIHPDLRAVLGVCPRLLSTWRQKSGILLRL
jgi:integrase